MSEQWQIRKGTKSENDVFTGALGEVTMDTTSNTVRVHDEVTMGGHELLSETRFNDYRTNCITSISQDIKIRYTQSEITLISGSKLYIPNGSRFDTCITTQDITYQHTQTGTNQFVLFAKKGALPWGTGMPALTICGIAQCVSGATDSAAGTQWHIWYDTTSNQIKRYEDNGTSITGYAALPLCIFTITNGSITSVDQIFNGLGYMGSTVYTLPGLQGLIPNGFNEDGSLKNNKVNCTTVKTVTKTTNYDAKIAIYANGTVDGWGALNYDPTVNYNQNSNRNNQLLLNAGIVKFGTNGKITEFWPKHIYKSVDPDTINQEKENIYGEKDFVTNPYIVNASSPALIIKNDSVILGTAPSGTKYSSIKYIDKNKKELGYTRHSYYASNSKNYSQMEVIAIDPDPSHTDNRINTALYLNTNGTNRSAQLNFSPGATNATSNNNIATLGWVNNPNLSTGIVHQTGNETNIQGNKTFKGTTIISGAAQLTGSVTISGAVNSTQTYTYQSNAQWPNAFLVKSTQIASNYNNPSADMSSVAIGNVANDGTVMSYLSVSKSAAGTTGIGLNVRNRADASSSNRNASMSLSIDKNGTVTTYAPSPASTNATSNNNIATVGWVNNPNYSKGVVHQTGNETNIQGTKKFKNTVYVENSGGYYHKATNVTSSKDSPSSTISSYPMVILDNADNQFAQIKTNITSSENQIAFMLKTKGNNWKTPIQCYTSGENCYARMNQNPNLDNNSTTLATTNYVKNYAMGLPDWSRSWEIAAGTAVSANGYVYARQRGTGDQALNLTINGNAVGGASTGHYGSAYSGLCAVAAGDVVNGSGRGGIVIMYLCCKNL